MGSSIIAACCVCCDGFHVREYHCLRDNNKSFCKIDEGVAHPDVVSFGSQRTDHGLLTGKHHQRERCCMLKSRRMRRMTSAGFVPLSVDGPGIRAPPHHCRPLIGLRLMLMRLFTIERMMLCASGRSKRPEFVIATLRIEKPQRELFLRTSRNCSLA